ncbi:MAG: hypothetical protein M1491_00845 [Deltaproteobacteria bacterium]|nr:hypothetical protein [Deltaproteobacteria bacterium]MCL5276240.1 hypothetical protein [Deltaproteobacteria bacterium]
MKKYIGIAGSILLSFFATFPFGCSSGGSGAQHVVIGQGCQPLSTDDCFLPYPSFYYTVQASTATGWRVDYPNGVLPLNSSGVPLSPTAFNTEDGFSPASQILAYFTQPISSASLPAIGSIDSSTLTTSSIQIIQYPSGQRVPLFAELDANVPTGQKQGLIIRPMIRLDTSTRYAVVILDSVKGTNGLPLQAPVPFRYLRDKVATDNSVVEGVRQHYEDLFSFLSAQGISRKDTVLAWDFTTASDQFITDHLLSMRDQALSKISITGIPYSFSTVTQFTSDTSAANHNSYLYKELIGVFTAPTFIDSNGYLVTDPATGLPKYVGQASYPLVVHIPACVTDTTLPIPIMVFGHGLFGTAQSEMESTYQESVIDQLCMVQVGTDWIGLSLNDAVNAILAIQDMNQFPLITDRLQQAQINVVTMARLALSSAFDSDPNIEYNGRPTIGSEIYYYGISDGGIQGTTFMSIDPDITRGVLGVPGAEWSLMIQRSHDFADLSAFFNLAYPNPLDRLKLLSLSQYFWDFTDPISFAPHIVKSPLEGTPAKHILIQAGVNDCQVPNIATEVLVRTMGIPALSPLPFQIYGISGQPGPLDSAFTLWDVPDSSAYVPPLTDTMPVQDNNVHEDIRRLPQVIQQIGLFFTPSGQVQQTCLGSSGCTYTSTTP